jgi:hypothetical protein
MAEYHGQKIEEGKKPQDVPPIPAGYRPSSGPKTKELRSAALSGFKAESLETCPGPVTSTVYPHVRMTGNYGIPFCPNAQTLDYYGITQDEAHSYAWSAFGACGHTILYFDANGNLVAQE